MVTELFDPDYTLVTFACHTGGMTVNRLHTRLILSSLLVVAITVGVMAVLLVVILRAQPVAADPIYARLQTLARALNDRDMGINLLVNAPEDRREQVLDELASRANVRILVGTGAEGVIYDSLRAVPLGDPLAVDWQGPAPEPGALQRGRFSVAGAEWLAVGQQVPSRRGGPITILLAEERPASSWGAVLRIFGASLLRPLLMAGAVGLGVAVLVAWLTSRGMVRGLGALSRAAGAVAVGDYGARVQVSGPDEVQAVGAAFNAMAGQVQAAQQTQQDFLANVTHDLRTPLTSIQGFSQAIIDGTSQDPAYHAQIIHDEAGRLNRMVGELLDLARIAAGRLSMRQNRVNPGLITGAVAERLAIRAREGGVQLVQDIQPVPDVAGDGDRLAQVFTNLIDNAIKFTPQGGTVGVRARVADGGAEITVSDTGQGIPADDLPRVFERFYQVDKSRGPRRGTGLGLAITAEIVQAHGGRIHVTSGGTGHGATFTVWLPALDATTLVTRRGG